MVELGALLDVSESWDNIIMPLDLKPGEVSNFQRGVQHAISEIITHPALSNLDKARYINTIIVGLEGLVKGNANYEYTIKSIRTYIRNLKEWNAILVSLKKKGFVVLPHGNQFDKIDLQGKEAVFLNEYLFDWRGALNLVEIGGEKVPLITLGGDKNLPLVVIPFTEESLQGVRQFNRDWHTWDQDERLPVIKTDRFIAIPMQACGLFLELAKTRAKGEKLSSAQEAEFNSVLQRINIITAEEVVTSYEITKPKENLRVIPQAEFEKSQGEVDSNAVNSFLVNPPISAQRAVHQSGQIPEDAKQRYILLENGNMIELGTGRIVGGNVGHLELLTNGWYKIVVNQGKADEMEQIYKPKFNAAIDGKKEGVLVSIDRTSKHKEEFMFSPSKRYVFVQEDRGEVYGHPVIHDLITDKSYYLHNDFSDKPSVDKRISSCSYCSLQFSNNENYLTYLEEDPDGQTFFIIVDLQKKEIVKRIDFGNIALDSVDYSLSPFANAAFVQFKDDQAANMFVDLTTGFILPAKLCRIDSSGTYATLVSGKEMSIYLLKSKKPQKWLHKQNFQLQNISSVFTGWDDKGRVIFGVSDKDFPYEGGRYFDEDGMFLAPPTRPVDFNYELFLAEGRIKLYGNGNPRGFKSSAYKHPHFDLFIDNSDPDNPVAINPKTGYKINYKGQIFHYEQEAARVWSLYNNKVYAFLSNANRELPDYVVDGNMPAKFSVHWGSINYYIDIYDRPDSMVRQVTLQISVHKYSRVYFDGKYFVFTDPKTGDFIYLDPENPGKLSEPQKPETTNGNVSQERGYILQENGNFVESRSGRVVEKNVKKVEYLSRGYYIITTDLQKVCYNPNSGVKQGQNSSYFETLGQNSEFEFIVSPSKRYITRQNINFGYVGYLRDLESGQEYNLDNNFSTKPSIEPDVTQFASPFPSYHNLQFSANEKYATYCENISDEESYFVVVDLGKKAITYKIKLDKEELTTYTVDAFANIAVIPSKFKYPRSRLVDLETGKSITISKVLHTDSSGTYTAITSPATGGEMNIYLHKTKKVLGNTDFNLNKIESVFTGYDDQGRTIFGVSDEDAPFDGKYFYENGQIINDSNFKPGKFYYELFTARGKKTLFGNENVRGIPLAEAQLDSSRQTNYKGLYKHPHLNLFIDESDANNPVAINPLTGRKFPYHGQVIGSNYEPASFNSETSVTWPERDYIVVEYKGEIRSIEYERETKDGPYRQQSRETVQNVWIRNVVISETAPCYAVGIDTKVTYKFFRIPPNHKLETPPDPGSFMEERLLISPQDYPYVYFDGNHFVFTNPTTGEVRKLNPKDPKDPLIVSFHEAEETKLVNNIPNIPEDVDQRLFLRNGELVEIGTGRSVLSSVQDMETLGNGYYKIVTHSKEEIRRFSHTKSGYELGGARSLVHRDIGKILFSPDKRFAFVQHWDGTVQDDVFCIAEGNWYYLDTGFSADFQEHMNKIGSMMKPPDFTGGGLDITPQLEFSNLQFSSDGEYLTCLEKDNNENKQLVIVELELAQGKIFLQNARKSIKKITVPKNVDYAINPFANVVFLQNKESGLMSLYDLKRGIMVGTSVRYLHTDSSGSYTTMVEPDGGIILYHHKTGTEIRPNLGGEDAGSISTLYLEDGSIKIIIRNKSGDRSAWINDDGSTELISGKINSGNKIITTEEFDFVKNGVAIYGGTDRSKGTGSNWLISQLDHFQRLDKTTLYFDTRFRLIIRNSDQHEGIAFDPVAAVAIPFSGIIIKYAPEGQKLFYKDGNELKESILYLGSRRTFPNFDVYDNSGKYRIVHAGVVYVHNDSDRLLQGGEIEGIDPAIYSLVLLDSKYFVFIDPTTGNAYYQEAIRPDKKPIFVSSHTQEKTNINAEEQNRAIELWNKHIASKRNDFIAQARSIYQPFLELAPEEYRGEIEHKIRGGIEIIYREQEKEILRRFQEIVEGRTQELDYNALMPLDHFQQRMNLFMEHLPGYLRLIANQISQEKPEYQKEFYSALFTNIFELIFNSELNLEVLDKTLISSGNLFEVLAFDWRISSQAQLEAAPIISSLIKNLREASNNHMGILGIACIIMTLSYFSSKDPAKNVPIVEKQLGKIFKLNQEARHETLRKINDAFNSIEDPEDARSFIDNPFGSNKLGEARPFIIFLSNDVEQVKEKARFIPKGEDKKLPEDGVEISQIVKLEQQRQKAGEDDVVITMKELIDRLAEQKQKLPVRSEVGEAEILKNTKVQRESGAYPAEITQNSRDATVGQRGELTVDWYLQKNGLGQKEYVEEATDNGPGALHEVALIIPKSTKDTGEQLELTGFFGTGKYTIFEGVDRVEIINKNQERAYMFTFDVIKDDSGVPKAIKLIGIRQINDNNVKLGVTVRRIKKIDNTIPELDQMLSQRSWKVFAGLSQNDNFKIYFIDHENKKTPLVVEKEVLSETDFMTQRPGEEEYTNFGKMRIISAKDMPLQIVDKAGLRVCEIKDEYLELIPQALRRHIEELGIIIQIPLPLIRNRSAFENENAYMPIIQKYVAIEFYKAIAYLTLTKTNPQFVFEGFPLDWETNDSYWDSIDLNDAAIVGLARKINEGRYESIRGDALSGLLTEKGRLDKEKKFVKALLLLQVATDPTKPGSKISLLLRRLAIQRAIDEANAKRQAEILKDTGMEIDEIPDIDDIPHHEEKIRQAGSIAQGHEQLSRPQDYIMLPETQEEHKLLDLALSIAKPFGIEQVLLVKSEARFYGAFINYHNEYGNLVSTMLINQSLTFGTGDKSYGVQDHATDTVVHELGHLLEGLMLKDTNKLLKEGYVAHMADFTHDAVGTFAEAMKYVSAVSLLRNASSAINMMSEIKQSRKPTAGSPVVENVAISASPLQIKGKVEFINLAVTEEELSVSVRNLLSMAVRVAEWAEQASNELELAGVIVGTKPAFISDLSVENVDKDPLMRKLIDMAGEKGLEVTHVRSLIGKNCYLIGTKENVNGIKQLMQEIADGSRMVDDDYHRDLGKLLGYVEPAIEKFIKDRRTGSKLTIKPANSKKSGSVNYAQTQSAGSPVAMGSSPWAIKYVLEHESVKLEKEKQERLRAMLGVCLLVVAYKNGERIMAHFEPLAKLGRSKKGYIKEVFSSSGEAIVFDTGLRVKIISSNKIPGQLGTSSREETISAEDLKEYLLAEGLKDNNFDPPEEKAIGKTVTFNSDGTGDIRNEDGTLDTFDLKPPSSTSRGKIEAVEGKSSGSPVVKEHKSASELKEGLIKIGKDGTTWINIGLFESLLQNLVGSSNVLVTGSAKYLSGDTGFVPLSHINDVDIIKPLDVSRREFFRKLSDEGLQINEEGLTLISVGKNIRLQVMDSFSDEAVLKSRQIYLLQTYLNDFLNLNNGELYYEKLLKHYLSLLYYSDGPQSKEYKENLEKFLTCRNDKEMKALYDAINFSPEKLGWLQEKINKIKNDSEGLGKRIFGQSTIGLPAEVKSSSSAEGKELGGIDMRSLSKNTVIQPMAASKALKQGTVPVSDKEWQEIEKMAKSGIAPSCERIREYLLSLQDPSSQTDKVLACIADILRQEEEKACGTESSLREILVLLESDKPVNELRLALTKIQVFAKEPQLIVQ